MMVTTRPILLWWYRCSDGRWWGSICHHGQVDGYYTTLALFCHVPFFNWTMVYKLYTHPSLYTLPLPV